MTEILWRPLPTAATKTQVIKVMAAIKAGEHFGMFLPAGSPMARDVKGCKQALENTRPFVVQAAVGMGLLSPEVAGVGGASFTSGGSIDCIETKPHFDLTKDYGPRMNGHETWRGRVLGLFMRPTAGFDGYDSMATSRNPTPERKKEIELAKLAFNELVRADVLNGRIINAPIEPVIECAFGGPDDIIVSMESVPVSPEIKALPTAHWFIPLTPKRESVVTLWSSSASSDFPAFQHRAQTELA